MLTWILHAFLRLLFISQKISHPHHQWCYSLSDFFRITQMPASTYSTFFLLCICSKQFSLGSLHLNCGKRLRKMQFYSVKETRRQLLGMRDAGLSKRRALVVCLLPSGYTYFYSYRGMMDHHTKTNCALKLRPSCCMCLTSLLACDLGVTLLKMSDRLQLSEAASSTGHIHDEISSHGSYRLVRKFVG